MRRRQFIVTLTLLFACSHPSEPESGVGKSREFVEGVTLSLVTSPGRPSAGQPIEFVATAYNATDARIQIGTACGPSMDVLVRGPRGFASTVLTVLVPNGAFTCELSPRHFVAPRDSQQVRFRVPAPSARGRYSAAAGLRRSDGLSNLSASVLFEVR